MANCSECTYLDIESDDDLGKYWCEKKLERHYATDTNCSNFCKAYSRSESANRNAYDVSKQSQSSGCYLTTIICNILKLNDNNIYLNQLRNFRNNVLIKDKKYSKILVEYDIIGPIIANYINNDPLKYQISVMNFYKYIKPIVNDIKNNNNELAIQKYIEMTSNFKKLYNINYNITSEMIECVDIEKSGHGKYFTKKITN